jgi:hypothetical protein
VLPVPTAVREGASDPTVAAGGTGVCVLDDGSMPKAVNPELAGPKRLASICRAWGLGTIPVIMPSASRHVRISKVAATTISGCVRDIDSFISDLLSYWRAAATGEVPS